MSDSIDGEGPEPTIASTEPEDAGDLWSVSGATSPPGARTFVATLWLEDALGRTVTGSEPVGEDGHFEISFRRSDLVPGVARFLLSIDDRDTGRSGVETPIPSADREITVTDLVPAPSAAQGYAALRERLRTALTDRGDIAGGADDDEVERVLRLAATERLAELSEAMGVATSTLEDMRTTVRTLPIGLAPAVGFVLVSAGLDLDVDALVEDEDLVRTAVELAVSRGLVDVEQIGAGTTEIGAFVVRLLGELAALDELGRPAVSGGIPIVDLVELALNEVDRADMLALAELVAAHDVLDDTFWTAIEDANWRTDDDQRALRHVFWLDELTLSSRPLVAHLIGVDPALSVEAAVELTVVEWEDLIQEASTRDESAVPDRFRTGGTQAQREAYAVHIASRLRRTHPSRAGRLLVVRVATAAALDDVDNPLSLLTAMLEADPEFDVVHGELGDEPAAVQERRLLQRALAGDDRDPVEAAFRYAGETARPVQAVARMGQRAFSASEGSAETYLSAAFANAAVITVYSDLRAAASAPRAEERVELTDWSNEFGEIDDTACEHCASV
jgi:hypothetical protein